MTTTLSRATSTEQQFAALDLALKSFERLSKSTTEEREAHDLELDAPGADLPPALAKHINKALQTKSEGIPAEFESAWAWAAHWVKENGMTLPPDTSYYRSLRNWFCYKVAMHKKCTLSKKSSQLLASYGIDLSKYRADNTGRGQRMDDNFFIAGGVSPNPIFFRRPTSTSIWVLLKFEWVSSCHIDQLLSVN